MAATAARAAGAAAGARAAGAAGAGGLHTKMAADGHESTSTAQHVLY